LTQNDNITIDGVEYVAQDDPDYSCGNQNQDCYFRQQNCYTVQELGKCYEKGIFWLRKEDMKSITQEIKEWKDKEISDQVPGTKYDQGKLQYTLVPPYALREVARNLTEGLKKYKERNNWQKVEGAEQRYMDALMRHFEAIRRGEIYDVDSSDPTISHMSAVAVNAMFLLEFMYNPELQKDLALPKTL
jgi:hypothetical protein